MGKAVERAMALAARSGPLPLEELGLALAAGQRSTMRKKKR